MTKIGATSLRIDQDVMGGGVKVVFDRGGMRYVRECTRWEDSIDNLRAIGLQIDYLYRALEIYGVDMSETSFDQEFNSVFAGFIATPDDTVLMLGTGKVVWHEVLGVKPEASKADIRNAFRALSKIHHPDAGGNEEDFKRLRVAYDEAMKVVKNDR
jgi:DnaJ-domain-containing protein 1